MLRPGGLRLVGTRRAASPGAFVLGAIILCSLLIGCGPRAAKNSDVDAAPVSVLFPAEQALRSGDLAAAQEAFEAIVRDHPGSWRAERGLQDVRRRTLSTAEFEQLYLERHQASPDDALAWYLLGRARIDRLQEALAAFQEAARLAPQSPWPPVGIAYVHSASGDMFLSVQAYEEALERMPRSAQLRKLLGGQFLTARLVVEAQRHLEIARRLDPEDPEIMAALGKVYIEMGRYESGRALLEEALAADPTLMDVMMSLASVYLRDREPVRAEEAYRRALEGGMKPDDALLGAIRAAKLVEARRGQR